MKYTLSLVRALAIRNINMLFSKPLSLALLAGTAAAREGFVTTNGEKFQLDGEDFYFAGSNAYYFPFDNVYTSPPNIYHDRH